MQQFDAQRNRGTEGFGLFDGQETHIVKESKEDNILKWLVKYDSNMLLFHHRYPTSTVNVKRAAHPFSTKDYFGDTQYILVHNGGIHNDDELFVDHQELGIEYQSLLQDMTFNDSESLLWDFALTMEGKQKEMKAYGRIAFVAIKKVDGKLDKLYFARNTNPLNMYRDRGGIMLSSEGEGEPIEAHHLYTYNYKLNRLTKKKMQVESFAPYTGEYAGLGNYDTTGKFVNDYSTYGTNGKWWEDDDGPYQMPSQGRLLLDGYNNPNLSSKFQEFLTRQRKETLEPEIVSIRASVTEAEVESKALSYLIGCKGVFEQAYWAAELDYQALEEEAESYYGDTYELRLMERVLEYLNLDPEYEDENSVSSIWLALCEEASKL